MDKLWKCIGEAACADIVDGQNGIALAHGHAGINHLLRTALHLRVASLHGIEVELEVVLTGLNRGGRATPEANAHARPTQLNQQRPHWNARLVHLLVGDDPHPAREHDGLVIAPVAVAVVQFETSKVARQVWSTELIVECGSTEWALDHDRQRRGHSRGLMWRFGKIQVRDRKACEARARLGPAARGALVSNLATCASGCTGKGADGSGVVVGLGLEHRVQHRWLNRIWARLPRGGQQPMRRGPLQNRGIVGIGRQRALGRLGMRVPNHLEETRGHGHAIDGKACIKNLVTTVLGIGLREHHQLDIGRVSAEPCIGLGQVGHLVI